MRERYIDPIPEDADLTPLSLAWALRRAGEMGEWDTLAAYWASQAFKGASEDIVREVIQDVLMAPILSYPGRSVRALCKACGGVSLAIRLLAEDGINIGLDPNDPSTWDIAPCPRCGGTGNEPEEVAGVATPTMWGDISWDWPPDSGDGHNGPEAR